MKSVIAVPPFHDFYSTPIRLSALGARVVEELLKQKGHETKLFNFPALDQSSVKPKKTTLPSWAGHLAPFVIENETGPTAFFTNYQRFGPSIVEAVDKVCSELPDSVYISLFAHAYGDDAVLFCRRLAKKLPGTPIYLGGAGPSAFPQFYRSQLADVPTVTIVTGEAEKNLLPSTEVPKLERTSISDRPIPAMVAVAGRKNTFHIHCSVTRGCPKRCSFCANHLCHGREFRTADIDDIYKKVKTLKRQIPTGATTVLHIEDDNLLIHRKFGMNFLNILSSEFRNLKIICENGLDYLTIGPEDIPLLKKIGFVQLNISLGAADVAAAARQNRPYHVEHHKEIVQAAAKYNLPCITYFICGLPGDNHDSIVKSLKYLAQLNGTQLGISPFYAVPGIPGFENETTLLELPTGLFCGSSLYPWTGSFTTSELMTFFRLSRYINLWKQAVDSTSPGPATKQAEKTSPRQFSREVQKLIAETQRTGQLHTFRKQQGKTIICPVPELNNAIVREVLGFLDNPNKLA